MRGKTAIYVCQGRSQEFVFFWGGGINFDQSALSRNDKNAFFRKLGQSKYYKYNAPIGIGITN